MWRARRCRCRAPSPRPLAAGLRTSMAHLADRPGPGAPNRGSAAPVDRSPVGGHRSASDPAGCLVRTLHALGCSGTLIGQITGSTGCAVVSACNCDTHRPMGALEDFPIPFGAAGACRRRYPASSIPASSTAARTRRACEQHDRDQERSQDVLPSARCRSTPLR